MAIIFLRSDLQFHVDAGATLLGSREMDDYPLIDGRHEGIERDVHASIITGVDLENVAVTGRGTIDGRGRPWWEAHWEYYLVRRELGLSREGHFPSPPEADLDHPRPRIASFVNCENVTMEGLTVDNPDFSPNTDG